MSDDQENTSAYIAPVRWNPPSVDDSQAVLIVIQQIALDPTVSIDRMRELLAMQERILARNAKREFTRAMAKIQPLMPTIERNGKIVIATKDTRDKPKDQWVVQQESSYAKWEDVWEKIRGPLGEHGFTLTFSSEMTPAGLIAFTGILTHEGGHEERTTLVLQHESSGSKNAVQAVGSSLSYGRRYTAGMLLNIVSKDIEHDDDGQKGGDPPTISAEQFETLGNLMETAKATPEPFLTFYSTKLKLREPLKTLADLPAAQYEHMRGQLEKKIKTLAASGGAK